MNGGRRRQIRRRIGTLASAASLSLAGWQAASAHADATSTQAESTYQENIARGLQEFDLEHWQEARVFFEQAHALQPSARTLRGLALTSYELRDYVEAFRYTQEALSSQVRPLTDPMRAEMQRILRQAQHFVGRLRVAVEPSTASVWVDGKPAAFQADGQLLLNPGSHEVVARAPGFDPAQQMVLAEGGDELDVELVLRTAASGATPSPTAAPNKRDTLGPWIMLGGSAAVAATGIVLLGVAAADIAHVEGAPDGADWSEFEDTNDRAPKLSAAGFVLLGAGVVGVASALAWKFWPRQADRNGRTALHVLPLGLRLTQHF